MSRNFASFIHFHTKFTFSNYLSITSWFFCYIKLEKDKNATVTNVTYI